MKVYSDELSGGPIRFSRTDTAAELPRELECGQVGGSTDGPWTQRVYEVPPGNMIHTDHLWIRELSVCADGLIIRTEKRAE